jgi:superfamily II DNA or RNA helicase
VSQTEREMGDFSVRLLPHQIALVDTVLNPASKRVLLLRGDVGLGKSIALVALARRLLQQRPAARALILVPRAMRRQFVEMLRDGGTPTLLVDRYQFREMLDSTTEGEIWPRGVVSVLSRDFAKQPDILESLARTHWDLVIADEAHGFTGTRAETLRRLGASTERIVLATATLPDLERTRVFPAEDVTVVEWQRDQIVDHSGKLFGSTPRPILHQVPFCPTPTELALQETMRHLCSVLEEVAQPQGWITKSILRSLQSSPPAVEGVLRRLMASLSANSDLKNPPEFVEEEVPEDGLKFQFRRSTADDASRIAGQALKDIEEMSVDSKLHALGELLNHITETKTSSQRICILTDYLATLFYLAAEIDGRGMGCVLLHGEMSVQDRQRALMSFAIGEGVLVATRAVMTEGITLGDTTDLVLYDIPRGKIVLQQVLGRFDRFGRRTQLSVHVLTPSDSVDGEVA